MSTNLKEKLPAGIKGVVVFMFIVLTALVIYWGLHISGTVSFV